MSTDSPSTEVPRLADGTNPEDVADISGIAQKARFVDPPVKTTEFSEPGDGGGPFEVTNIYLDKLDVTLTEGVFNPLDPRGSITVEGVLGIVVKANRIQFNTTVAGVKMSPFDFSRELFLLNTDGNLNSEGKVKEKPVIGNATSDEHTKNLVPLIGQGKKSYEFYFSVSVPSTNFSLQTALFAWFIKVGKAKGSEDSRYEDGINISYRIQSRQTQLAPRDRGKVIEDKSVNPQIREVLTTAEELDAELPDGGNTQNGSSGDATNDSSGSGSNQTQSANLETLRSTRSMADAAEEKPEANF